MENLSDRQEENVKSKEKLDHLKSQQDEDHRRQRELADAITAMAAPHEIRCLLASGARADRPVTQGLHPIHYAAYRNNIDAVKLLIARNGVIDAMDDNGYTAVHLAAERGHYELLKFLINIGARVCFTSLKEYTNLSPMADEPLSLALKHDYLDCAELLLKNGADPNAKYFMGSEINLVSVLNVPALRLLLQYGAKPDGRHRSGLTPLMMAARHPDGYEAVKVLIEHGADVNDIAGQRHDYRTVLHHSIFSGNLEIIRLLLNGGARYPRLDFDKASPLDIAIISGRHDIAKLLIEFDADVNAGAATTIGQPLHTALTQRVDNKLAITRLLLDSGADVNSRNTSNRNTGPPLRDYLHSMRQAGGQQPASSSPDCNRSSAGSAHGASASFSHELVRMLLAYGARVILKTPAQHPLGLVRTLERMTEELDLELLQLLIEAAEEIDWFMMAKVIYACLRHLNRHSTNELFDPSVSADMTPQRLEAILRDPSAHYRGTCESIVRLMNQGRCSSAVLSLKQLARIKIRRHLTNSLQLRGGRLISAIEACQLPPTLADYMLYIKPIIYVRDKES